MENVSAENGKNTIPADNSLVAKVPSMGKTETNEAIQAAKSFLVFSFGLVFSQEEFFLVGKPLSKIQLFA